MSQNSNQEIKMLLVNQLKDLYSAENQLVKALPELASAAHSQNLKNAFQEHLTQTQGHVRRLEEAFQELGEKTQSKQCKGMMGIIDEGKETISEGKQMSNATSDLALIAAAQRAEHYEISGYGSVKTMAEELGQNRVVSLLEQTESEEKQVDRLLTNLAEPMYKQAGM